MLIWLCPCADDLRVELWGPFLTVSGTRNGAAMGARRPRGRLTGAGLVLRRELDHGFFSATWKLPVSFLLPPSSVYSRHAPPAFCCSPAAEHTGLSC